MVIAKHTLLATFYLCNDKYFGGILPCPKLEIMHSYRTLGFFSCEYDLYGGMFNESIKMSDNYDYTEAQLTNIFVHEMIHYYLAYMRIDTRCTHGKEFKKMATELNSKYGLGITSTIDLTPYKIKEGKSNFMFKLCTFF